MCVWESVDGNKILNLVGFKDLGEESGQEGLGWEVTNSVCFCLKYCPWMACEKSVEELCERYLPCRLCMLTHFGVFTNICVGYSFNTCSICLFLHRLEGLCLFTGLALPLGCEPFRAVST